MIDVLFEIQIKNTGVIIYVDTLRSNMFRVSPYKSWNSKLIYIGVKETFDVTYTQGGMRDMLRRLDFSYTKPTYSLAKAASKTRTV